MAENKSLPGMSEICRKDSLARNLNRMIRLFPKDYNIFPKSWCLPSDWNDIQNYARKHKSRTYILKPDNGCQGRGIYITRNAKDIRPMENMICQVYISKPFLIDGYKFDMRIYVLLTSCDPLRLFVFKDGLVRFTTCSYAEPNHRNVHDMYMHLTNYAVQKHSESYIRDNEEGGTKRRITTLNRWFTDNGYDVKKVNHSPSFTTDSKLDKEIKETMLWDAIQLAHITAISKKKCCDEERRRIRNRLLHKSGDKQHRYSIEKDMERYQAISEKYESTHLGNFRLIYPSSDMEKYSPFLNPTSTFYQETVTYKVRSECARQLREEIRLKHEKLDMIANQHKPSQSESPAPKRLKIKINTAISQLMKPNDNSYDVINDSDQLIPVNQSQFITSQSDIGKKMLHGQQINEQQQYPQKLDEGLKIPTKHNDHHVLPEALINNEAMYIDTKLPQPILDHEEVERINELKRRESQMHKIGLISMLHGVFAQHNSNIGNQIIKRMEKFNSIEKGFKEYQLSQQKLDEKERFSNVLKPTISWQNRAQRLTRQRVWMKNQENDNSIQVKSENTLDTCQTAIVWDNPKSVDNWDNRNTQSVGIVTNQCTDNYSMQTTNGNHFINSAQPIISNSIFGPLPCHQSQKIQQQKYQQSNRALTGNIQHSGVYTNVSSLINHMSSQINQNLPLPTDRISSYQYCIDPVVMGVRSYQANKNSSSETIYNSASTVLRINANSGFLPSRNIRSHSALKSKYTFTDLTNCNNNSNNNSFISSHNTSRQSSHNSSSKDPKTVQNGIIPLPTLANNNIITCRNANNSPQLITNALIPAVTSVKLNRVTRRSANQ
ncbi:unnamed protein product [Heterobilharzia americana]|nr:unnamed protein product [Heterobilharzia americana]